MKFENMGFYLENGKLWGFGQKIWKLWGFFQIIFFCKWRKPHNPILFGKNPIISRKMSKKKVKFGHFLRAKILGVPGVWEKFWSMFSREFFEISGFPCSKPLLKAGNPENFGPTFFDQFWTYYPLISIFGQKVGLFFGGFPGSKSGFEHGNREISKSSLENRSQNFPPTPGTPKIFGLKNGFFSIFGFREFLKKKFSTKNFSPRFWKIFQFSKIPIFPNKYLKLRGFHLQKPHNS